MGEATVHRVVATAPLVRTRGDAHGEEDDDPIDPEAICGRVAAVIRGTRWRTTAHGLRGLWASGVTRRVAQAVLLRRPRSAIASMRATLRRPGQR